MSPRLNKLELRRAELRRRAMINRRDLGGGGVECMRRIDAWVRINIGGIANRPRVQRNQACAPQMHRDLAKADRQTAHHLT